MYDFHHSVSHTTTVCEELWDADGSCSTSQCCAAAGNLFRHAPALVSPPHRGLIAADVVGRKCTHPPRIHTHTHTHTHIPNKNSCKHSCHGCEHPETTQYFSKLSQNGNRAVTSIFRSLLQHNKTFVDISHSKSNQQLLSALI